MTFRGGLSALFDSLRGTRLLVCVIEPSTGTMGLNILAMGFGGHDGVPPLLYLHHG